MNVSEKNPQKWYGANTAGAFFRTGTAAIAVFAMMILMIGTAGADTFVEGNISIDTTWTPADSPYVVSDDVFVDQGITLTIEPGVDVRFGGYFSIIVNGNLSAVGTESKRINFTSNKLTPAAGDWNTIKLNGAANSSLEMENAIIKYGKYGVTVESPGRFEVTESELLNNSEAGVYVIGNANAMIIDNLMRFNKYGIYGYSYSISGISLIDNRIINNSNYGSYVDGSSDVYDIILSNNTVSYNSGNGIYVYSDNKQIYNITLSNNIISYNNDNGVYVYGNYADIYDITLSNNIISYNGGNGVYVYIYGYGYSNKNVYNLTLSNNTLSYNGGDGVYVYGKNGDIHNLTLYNNTMSYNTGNGVNVYTYYYSNNIYNLTLSNNTISSNNGKGIYINGKHSSSSIYDAEITSNIITTNDLGIEITGGSKANITNNSISYNDNIGVNFSGSTGNTANFNDIYKNKYGMNVSSASVNADRNYWGESSGPYHVSMNPRGLGNPVNGDGVDLDFIPFLTSPNGVINQQPVPHITADKNFAGVNESVRFDASGSTDDQRVVDYYFDYGDGTNTSWVTTSVVVHKFLSEGIYNVTLKVRDEFGVESNYKDYINITIGKDLNPPASISNLNNISYAPDYINWTWTDPADTDFSYVMVYIDGIFKNNVSKGIEFYNSSGFTQGSEHTISTRTVDANNNVNGTWMNRTATTVKVPVMTTITVSPTTATVIEGNTITFTATMFDQNGAAIEAIVTWSSSNTRVGTIDPDTGVFTAEALGTTTITATNGSVVGFATVTVTQMPILEIATTMTSVTAGTGTSVTFTVKSNGLAVSGATVTLGGVATGSQDTDANGNATIFVNATSPGTIIATASKNGYISGSIILTAAAVEAPVLTTIMVLPTAATVNAGNTIIFTAIPLDQNGAAIEATVTWSSSNTSVGTIDPRTGIFTAAAAGTTTITAANGSIASNPATATVILQANALIADINGDNIVNYKDLGLLGASYGLSVGDAGYNANADLNDDGIVNYKDLGILGAHYGEQK